MKHYTLFSLCILLILVFSACTSSEGTSVAQTPIAATSNAISWTSTPTVTNTPSPTLTSTPTPTPTPIGNSNWLIFDTTKCVAKKCEPAGISMIRTNGMEQKIITGTDYWLVDISPNGQKILTLQGTKFDPGSHNKLYVMNLDGSNSILITDKVPADTHLPAYFMQDDQHIVFLATEGNEDHIFITNYAGSNVRRVTQSGSKPWPLGLVKSGDNNKIYWEKRDLSPYSYYSDYHWSIKIDGTDPQQLRVAKMINLTFSSPGDYIAFRARRNFRFDLYISKVDGSQKEEVAQGFSNSRFANYSWSPDGKTLLVNNINSGEKFMLNIKTGEKISLPSKLGDSDFDFGVAPFPFAGQVPTWSVDGQNVLCIIYPKSGPKIYALNITSFSTTEIPITLPENTYITSSIFIP